MQFDEEFQALSEFNGEREMFKNELIAQEVRKQISQSEMEAAFRKSIIVLFERVAEIHPELKNLDVYREMHELNDRIEDIKIEVKEALNNTWR